MKKVLVICTNGLQTAYLGAYGNPWIHTPNIDRLAAESTVFDWHYSDNLTTIPTRRSWWSGQFTLHDPLRGWGPVSSPKELKLIQLLKSQKVRTTLISDCPYVNDPSLGYARAWPERILVRGSGYDAWCDPNEIVVDCSTEPGLVLPPEDDPNHLTWKERWNDLLRNRLRTGRLDDESQTGVAQAVSHASQWLGQHGQNDFLLWLDLFCPHGPWDLPESYRDYYAADRAEQFEIHESGDIAMTEDLSAKEVRTLIDVPGGWLGEVISDDELVRLRKTYAGAVTMLDTWVGRLLDEMRDSGLLDQTIVVFMSDQGEPLGEHGFVRRPVANLHEELTHTPLIVRWPDQKEAGQRCQKLVQPVDLAATILQAFQIEKPDHWPGMDLRQISELSPNEGRNYAILGMDNEIYAIRTPDWLLLNLDDPETADDETEPELKPQLYVKPEDRWERHDVAALHEDIVDELVSQLNELVNSPKPEEA